MVKEMLEALDVRPGRDYIDATVGEGGHAENILKRSKTGFLLGIDRDPQVAAVAKKRLAPYQGRFKIKTGKASRVLGQPEIKARKWQGVLFDLGISSWHLEQSGRGFSFQKDEPLDMRLEPGEPVPTAADLLNTLSKKELKELFVKFSQTAYAGTIASRIVEARGKRPFSSSGQLVEVIKGGVPTSALEGKRHPATPIFQSLRIAVNQELAELKAALQAAWELKPRRLVIITFHSLEESQVNQFFKGLIRAKQARKLYKQPRAVSIEEKRINPRARSAKLYGFSALTS